MNNAKNASEESLLLKISAKLMETQKALDDLAVQLALGTAEAKDKFEEIKKEFHAKVSEIKNVIAAAAETEDAGRLKARLKELETLLCSGQAQSKEAFESQKTKLLQVILKIEEILKAKFHSLVDVPQFSHDMETFRLKLQLIRLKFVLKKFIIKDSFRTAMSDARQAAKNIVDGVETKLNQTKARYRDFSSEIQSAYDHMKRAVRNK